METERFIQIMEGAKAAILERGWCQRELVDDDGRLCLLGGLIVSSHATLSHRRPFLGAPGTPEWTAYLDVYRDFKTILDGYPHRWNDAEGRTEAEVLAFYDDAIIWKKEHDGN